MTKHISPDAECALLAAVAGMSGIPLEHLRIQQIELPPVPDDAIIIGAEFRFTLDVTYTTDEAAAFAENAPPGTREEGKLV